MANKLTLLIDFAAYTAALATNNPSDDATKVKLFNQEANYSDLSRQQILVANSTTDQAITLVKADCEYLMILVDQPITIKLNGSSTPLAVKPRTAGVKSLGLFIKGDTSTLTVSNSSGSAANLDVISVKL